MDCCRSCQRRVVEVNHYIYFLGRKKQKRRHCRGRVRYWNANITEYDIKYGTCWTCLLVVFSIEEEIDKSSQICKGNREEKGTEPEKTETRSVAIQNPSQASVSLSSALRDIQKQIDEMWYFKVTVLFFYDTTVLYICISASRRSCW